MDPITREEKLMAGEQLEPITRKEYFLAKAAGMDVETPEPITREEMFLSMISGGGTGGSGGADWNAKEGEPGYVKNRTHYEEMTIVNEPLNITWDGNTEGLVSTGTFYKVSDLVLSDEQIKLVTLTTGDDTQFLPGDLWDSGQIIVSSDVTVAVCIAVVRKDNAKLTAYDTEIVFPEKGLYFSNVPGYLWVASLTTTEPVEHIGTAIHKLDKKYLPDEVCNGSKLIINASTSDYNTYTIDRSYAEIKEYADNGCDVAVQFMWIPNPNDVINKPALYIAPLVQIQSDGSMLFTVDSYYPEYGAVHFAIEENKAELFVNSYLPFAKNKGSYLVGKNSFDWEISPYPIVYSPNGTKYKISVDNNGTLSATKVT